MVKPEVIERQRTERERVKREWIKSAKKRIDNYTSVNSPLILICGLDAGFEDKLRYDVYKYAEENGYVPKSYSGSGYGGLVNCFMFVRKDILKD